jgi:hypothetical protein
MHAVTVAITGIIGAGVVVAAALLVAGETSPVLAVIGTGTGVTISTRAFNVVVITAAIGQTDILGARIGIVTFH